MDIENILEEESKELKEEKSQLPETSTELSSVVKKINKEDDVEKVKDLTKLFNLAMLKKEINRAEKQSDMLDYALDEVYSRITTGEMPDKDLANYIKIFQDAINNSRKNTSEETLPHIQINTNEININRDELSREERENVLEFIQTILTQSKSDDIIDVNSEVKESEEQDD